MRIAKSLNKVQQLPSRKSDPHLYQCTNLPQHSLYPSSKISKRKLLRFGFRRTIRTRALRCTVLRADRRRRRRRLFQLLRRRMGFGRRCLRSGRRGLLDRDLGLSNDFPGFTFTFAFGFCDFGSGFLLRFCWLSGLSLGEFVLFVGVSRGRFGGSPGAADHFWVWKVVLSLSIRRGVEAIGL